MSVYLRGQIWWCKFKGADGKQYSLSTKCENKRDALIKEAEFIADVEEGYKPASKERLTGDKLTVREAFEKAWRGEWREHKSLSNKIRNGGYVLEALGDFADQPLALVTMKTVADCRDKLMKRYAKQSTVNRKIAELSALVTVARNRWGMYELPVLSGVQLPEGDNKRERILETHEEDKVLQLAYEDREDMGDLIKVLIYSGCRVNEVLNLTVKDIEFDTGLLVIRKHKSKGSTGRPKIVQMADVVKTILKKRVAGLQNGERPFENLTYNMAQKRWDTYRTIMGLSMDEGFVLHGLRHTFATRMLAAGCSIYDVKTMLGHSTVATTERYAHAASRVSMETMNMLNKIAYRVNGENSTRSGL